MPRTSVAAVTPQQGAQLGVVSAGDLDIAMTAIDTVNHNEVPWTSNELLLHVWNDSATPYTLTVTSISDSRGRVGDITTYSLAGDDHVYARFSRDGWEQTGGLLYLTGSNAALKFVVLNL